MCNKFPEVVDKMRHKAIEYDDPWKKFKKTVLAKIDYFSEHASHPEFLEEIHYAMEEEYIDKGIEIAGPD